VVAIGMRRHGLDRADPLVIVTHGTAITTAAALPARTHKRAFVWSELGWRMTETQLDFESASGTAAKARHLGGRGRHDHARRHHGDDPA
jgi:hypothetical protein